jgi:hypothetical protein
LIGKARGSLEPSPPPGLVGCSSSSGNGDSARSQGPGLGSTGDCWRGGPSEMRG